MLATMREVKAYSRMAGLKRCFVRNKKDYSLESVETATQPGTMPNM